MRTDNCSVLSASVLLIFLIFHHAIAQNSAENVGLVFYSGLSEYGVRNSLSDHLAAQLLANGNFDVKRPTVLYIHGYLDEDSARNVVGAYRRHGDHNVLAFDWSAQANGNYLFNAVPNCRKLSLRVAETLLNAFHQGIPIERFHVVGHSLGAQMAGFIGRHIRSLSKNRMVLPRITALDPANPPFYLDGTHLVASDARAVDVIHTDAWLYGAPISTGTIDFWPNAGKSLQPGCPRRNYLQQDDNDFCSHRKSWSYYAESLSEPYGFAAVRAANWADFQRGRIGDTVAYMGIDCNVNVKGDFYLQTNAQTPFGRGRAGLRYV